METSYLARIHMALGRLGKNGTTNPDEKSNSGRLLGEAYLWQEIRKFAEKREEAAFDALQKSGLLSEFKEPGQYVVAESPSFSMTADVSQPVRRFDEAELGELLLHSKFKVPLHVTSEAVTAAKVPGKSRVIKKIIEKT